MFVNFSLVTEGVENKHRVVIEPRSEFPI
jgi:hypothetical protein